MLLHFVLVKEIKRKQVENMAVADAVAEEYTIIENNIIGYGGYINDGSMNFNSNNLFITQPFVTFLNNILKQQSIYGVQESIQLILINVTFPFLDLVYFLCYKIQNKLIANIQK